jgi:hypothetical protein
MSDIPLFNSGISNKLDRSPRTTKRALDKVHGHGLVSAAKVEAAAFVTHVALQEIGLLSMEEALLVQTTPHAEGRAKLIVDNFTAVAAGTVARMGYQS